MKTLKLNNGIEMPALGFGTWQLSGKAAEGAVKTALEAGYRLIDTARIYGNEAEVGQAIKDSEIKRDEVFLTTKVWTSDLGYDNTRTAFDESLQRLGLDYIDLYLIHWPGEDPKLRSESWRALVEFSESGSAKSVGVSNFDVRQIEALAEKSGQVPAVNQIEFHPFIFKRQKPVLDYCKRQGIVVEAYSPLAQASDLKNSSINDIAKTHGKSSAQVMLRWAIQHGSIPIPRSANSKRIAENLEVFDFELTDGEMDQLNSLSTSQSVL